MRRQDELTVLYRGQPPLARKYLLSQMESLGLAFDSDELLAFLQAEVGDPEAAVSAQALCSLARFLPAFLRKRYALSEQALGVWSAYARPGAPVMPAAPAATAESDRAVSHAALHAARELAEALAETLKSATGWNRARAALALGQFGLHAAERALSGALGGGELAVGLALARLKGQAGEPALLSRVAADGVRQPELYLLLATCRTPAAFERLMAEIPRAGTVGRMNLARSLAAQTTGDAPAAFDRLVQDGEGWVVAAALGAAEELGRADLCDRVARVYHASRHEMLQRLALKAAGGIASDAALDLARGAMAKGSDALRAVALETMVRLRAEPAELAEAARPHVGSAHLKLAVTAMLAALEPAEALRAPRLNELLFSTDVLSRLEAAYCLGYLVVPQALDFLGVLAEEDPSPAVRTAALKSMSRWPAREAVPPLLAALGARDAGTARTAARLLMRFDGAEAGVVAEAMEERLADAKRPARGLAWWVLGSAARKAHRTASLKQIERGFGEAGEALAGVIEAANLLSAGCEAGLREHLVKASAHENPRVAARALVARWNAGDLAAAGELARRLRDPAAAESAVESALEIGLLLPEVARGRHFPALTAQLAEAARDPAVEEFARTQVELGASMEARPEKLRAPADFQPVARPEARPEATPASASRQTAQPASAGHTELRRFLATRPDRGTPLERRVAQETVLLDPSFGRSYAAYLGQMVRAHPVVTALLGVLFVAGALTAGRNTGETIAPPPPGFPGAMWVAAVRGDAKSASGPLQVRAPIAPGARLTTGPGGEATLATPEGNQLVLRAASALTVDAAAPGTPAQYRFRELAGDISFEFRRNAHFELIFSSGRLTATGAHLSLSREPAPRALSVVAGRATWETAGKTVTLERGDRVTPE